MIRGQNFCNLHGVYTGNYCKPCILVHDDATIAEDEVSAQRKRDRFELAKTIAGGMMGCADFTGNHENLAGYAVGFTDALLLELDKGVAE